MSDESWPSPALKRRCRQRPRRRNGHDLGATGVPLLLVLSLLVPLLCVLKGTVEEVQCGETEAVSMPVAMKRGVTIRESHGPSDATSVARSAMEEYSATRRRRLRVCQSHMQEARRGSVLMAVLGPCRGLERSTPPSE